MIVPGVKSHFLSPSRVATEGMSGGLLAVSNSVDGWIFGGVISKKISGSDGRSNEVGSIPASVVSSFVESSLWQLRNGRLNPANRNAGSAIVQDVEARLEHPLNVRIGSFSYSMEAVQVGSKSVKTIRVLPDDNLDLHVVYSPYSGINDFKRMIRMNPACELRLVAMSLDVSDGYRIVRQDDVPISTYEFAMSHLILSESQKHWMNLPDLVLRMDCPDQAKRLASLQGLVKAFRGLESRYRSDFKADLLYKQHISEIESKILNPDAEDIFPMNFVLPLNPQRPCEDASPKCQRQLEATELVYKIRLILMTMFERV
ncbi:MAG: hypothetical protein EOP06_16370 [Proteobacteria bacterium]|nr:MAG: hypothetical protein EOP06_16370 [Pseudomonadota bacterium]